MWHYSPNNLVLCFSLSVENDPSPAAVARGRAALTALADVGIQGVIHGFKFKHDLLRLKANQRAIQMKTPNLRAKFCTYSQTKKNNNFNVLTLSLTKHRPRRPSRCCLGGACSLIGPATPGGLELDAGLWTSALCLRLEKCSGRRCLESCHIICYGFLVKSPRLIYRWSVRMPHKINDNEMATFASVHHPIFRRLTAIQWQKKKSRRTVTSPKISRKIEARLHGSLKTCCSHPSLYPKLPAPRESSTDYIQKKLEEYKKCSSTSPTSWKPLLESFLKQKKRDNDPTNQSQGSILISYL